MRIAQNPNEIFDIVDAEDNVIGRATRQIVHRDSLFHRAIHVIIRNSKGSIYLQKRSMLKDKNPGVWDSSVSGHLDSGENYLQGAKRECCEELGIDTPPNLKALAYVKACQETGNEFVTIFTGKSKGPFHPPEAEIEYLEAFSKPVIDQMINETPDILSPCFRYLWTNYISAELNEA